ncbi:MAG: hypothetical protein EHM72_11185, partial [Calditrichaeota bacterium]
MKHDVKDSFKFLVSFTTLISIFIVGSALAQMTGYASSAKPGSALVKTVDSQEGVKQHENHASSPLISPQPDRRDGNDLLIMDAHSGDIPVIVEAESGVIGSIFRTGQDGDITYVATKTNYIGTGNPSDENSLITYQVAFQDSGYYNLFARLRVGSGAFDDDSFFGARGFGEKNVASSADWVFINGLASAGFSSPTDVVDGPGSLGSQVWKWVNITQTFYPGSTPTKSFYVSIDDLENAFQVAAREDGLDIDKFAFGKSNLYFTVNALDHELPGSITKPEPDSSQFYQGPP